MVAGCHKAAKRPATPRVVPDAAAIDAARLIEHNLLAVYDQKIASASAAELPQLQVERAIHATHLKALGTEKTGAAPAPGAPPAGGIKADLRRSIGELQGLSLRATSGSNAALFASVAASHQVSLG